MRRIILSFFAMCSITAMAQSIPVNTYTPVQTPQSSYDRIGHLNSIMNGSSNGDIFQYFPTPAPKAQSTPKTQLVKGTYFDGRKWKTASVRLAEDNKGCTFTPRILRVFGSVAINPILEKYLSMMI
ncbi:hypothetical protein [Prevotella pallens]|uniref:hypothetical protein n=1 Tax=Prevotella pallens TaxID=60133 RepID=UPI001CB32489|nr:hypothetical protein [Prevotella pallens]MBF1465272.1 hypothetical protein [Prevotella pallens]